MSGQLHASEAFRERALAWWRAKMKSEPTAILVKGDGFFCFGWSDSTESGKYHVPIETVLMETKAGDTT